MKTKEYLWLFLLVCVPSALGVLYAVHNTDPHHWGFITATILESFGPKKFFTDIYIQYGVGQSLLFAFLKNFFPVNYTSIGVFTSFLYSLTLVVLYFSVRKIAGVTEAFLLSALAVLLHSYAIYPWPDYYAGFCLVCACYLLMAGGGSRVKGVFAGVLFFAAFLFRGTYILGFLAAMGTYAALALRSRELRDRTLASAVHAFLALSFGYLLFLFSRGELFAWYDQIIGAGSSDYGIGFKSLVRIITRPFFLYNATAVSAQVPGDILVNISLTAMFYAAAYTVLSAFLGKLPVPGKGGLSRGVILFLALLGLAGLSQAVLGYEMFRMQNSCSSLYLIVAVWIAVKIPDFRLGSLPFGIKVFIFLFFLGLLLRFPYASNLFKLYDGSLKNYSSIDIQYYKWHLFRPEAKEYYSGLAGYACGGEKILNLTRDAAVPYICGEWRSAIVIPMYSEMFAFKTDPERVDEIRTARFRPGEIIVSDFVPPPNPRVRMVELGRVKRPASFRFMAGDGEVKIYRTEIPEKKRKI